MRCGASPFGWQHKQTSYRSTCSSPGVTVPGRITPAPLRVPSWTWKTGRRVRPDDCNRVFNTSSGQVTMAPTVPLHLWNESGALGTQQALRREDKNQVCSLCCHWMWLISFHWGVFFHQRAAEELQARRPVNNYGLKQFPYSAVEIIPSGQNTSGRHGSSTQTS